MLTSKQRAHLRGIAHNEQAIFQIGKNGVTPELVQGLDEALTSRELIKISVLDNYDADISEVAETLRGRTRSEVVQVIGRKIVLFRRRQKGSRFEDM